jgi:hypothetical protein
MRTPASRRSAPAAQIEGHGTPVPFGDAIDDTSDDVAPPLGKTLRLDFAGIDRPVLLVHAGDILPALLSVSRGWAITVTNLPPGALPDAPLATLIGAGSGRYDHHSVYLLAPLTGLAPASAVCSLVADLAQHFFESRPGWLALHCGAVLSGGRVIAMAGQAKAGKSTLAARLSAEPDLSVICDDVLPVDPNGIAMALGVGPRLRLPLPPAASALFRAHVDATMALSDRRYGYLHPRSLHPNGPAGPLGAVLLLDRTEIGPASLHPVAPPEAVAHLLARNMAPGNLDDRLAKVTALAEGAACLRLVYSDLEDAVALIRAAFPPGQDWPAIAPEAPLPASAPRPDTAPPARAAPAIDLSQGYRAASNVAVRAVGEALFLCLPDDQDIVHLNATGAAIWHLLSDPGSGPVTGAAIADLLSEAFPQEPALDITRDVGAILADLAATQLIQPAQA